MRCTGGWRRPTASMAARRGALYLADAEAARPAKEAAADAAAAAEAQAKVDAEVATKVEAVFREADKNKSGTPRARSSRRSGCWGSTAARSTWPRRPSTTPTGEEPRPRRVHDAGQGLHDVDLVEAVFKQADKDNSGTIEAKELKRVLGHFGLSDRAAREGGNRGIRHADEDEGRPHRPQGQEAGPARVPAAREGSADGAARRKEALAEVMVRVEGEFVKADKNKSGTIDWKELKKGWRRSATTWGRRTARRW